MFPQFKKINNESGVVLFLVLMTAIIIMIFSVGILTQSINETNYAQQQIDQIVSEELSKGLFWKTYSTGMTTLTSSSNVMAGRDYAMNVIAGTTVNGITTYNVVTSYDTF